MSMCNAQDHDTSPLRWVRQLDVRNLTNWSTGNTDSTSDISDLIAQTDQLNALLLSDCVPSYVFTLASRHCTHSLRTLHLCATDSTLPGIGSVYQLRQLSSLHIVLDVAEKCHWPTPSTIGWEMTCLRELTWLRRYSTKERAELDLNFLLSCRFPMLEKLILQARHVGGITAKAKRMTVDLVARQERLRMLDISGSMGSTSAYKHYLWNGIQTVAFSVNLPNTSILQFLPPSVRVLGMFVDPSNTSSLDTIWNISANHTSVSSVDRLWALLDELGKRETNVEEVHMSFKGRHTFTWTTPSTGNDPREAMLIRHLLSYSAKLSKSGIRLLDQLGHGLDLT
jgi:hypothetical protein